MLLPRTPYLRPYTANLVFGISSFIVTPLPSHHPFPRKTQVKKVFFVIQPDMPQIPSIFSIVCLLSLVIYADVYSFVIRQNLRRQFLSINIDIPVDLTNIDLLFPFFHLSFFSFLFCLISCRFTFSDFHIFLHPLQLLFPLLCNFFPSPKLITQLYKNDHIICPFVT